MNIKYRNTDFDLISTMPLDPLIQTLEVLGLVGIANHQDGEGNWHATFEFLGAGDEDLQGNVEDNITAVLDVLDQLSADDRKLLDQCMLREFNTAYDLGTKPNGFNDGLALTTLARMVSFNASFRMTLYTGV
ncbi:hypothetical protein [Loktanella sp. Alg231-35]|uniref:hypothetical protein n=1 Tax=Loktanella sp. Alg231-35 TaxID=1922220 RepID=UPI000D55EF7C|nr:hypothetical protein [Loktanella sp. Alg231-35]